MKSQTEFFGRNSLHNVEAIIEEIGAKNILLVTGDELFSKSGAKAAIHPFLRNKNVTKFSEFMINPALEDVMKGIEAFKQNQPDLILAVGGGSVLDMAKLISILSVQSTENIESIIYDQELIHEKGVPCVAIPTTAGTGSEATHFAVVYVNKVKYSLAHDYMLPDYSIIDFQLSCSVSKKVAASCAMDALSQAVESFWAVGSTKESKEYATRAITSILPIMEQAVNNQDSSTQERMAIGANFSGKAINISKTTAAHAISYPITTHFHVPHGHAVALTLGEFFVINSNFEKNQILDQRGSKYLKEVMNELYKIFNCVDAQSCRRKWHNIMNQIGLERNLFNLGINKGADIELITSNINLERLDNNPVKVDKQILDDLFASLTA